jgi:hypothetical protein
MHRARVDRDGKRRRSRYGRSLQWSARGLMRMPVMRRVRMTVIVIAASFHHWITLFIRANTSRLMRSLRELAP